MLPLVLIAALMLPGAQETKPVSPPVSPSVSPPLSIGDEVLRNVKSQPLGAGTVDDLAAPDDFLRRVSDRIIRSSFEERYRVVVPDKALEAPGAGGSPDTKPGAAPGAGGPKKSGSAAEKQSMIVLIVATTALLVLVAFAVLAIRGRSRSGT